MLDAGYSNDSLVSVLTSQRTTMYENQWCRDVINVRRSSCKVSVRFERHEQKSENADIF